MAVPKLPKWRIRITYTTRTDTITDFGATFFDHHVVHGVDENLFHVFDLRLAKNIIVTVGMAGYCMHVCH